MWSWPDRQLDRLVGRPSTADKCAPKGDRSPLQAGPTRPDRAPVQYPESTLDAAALLLESKP
jgi:hypothetical protein